MNNYKKVSVWLWYGIEGIGKFSLVTSFLKWLFKIDNINHPDILVVDSDIAKIADIRLINDFISTTTYSHDKKFVVFDNFDKISVMHQNVLLKMLETQLTHVVFIIISHNLSFVLKTIISRCFLLKFCSLSNFDIKNITGIKNDALLDLAGGSAGQAVKIRDEKGLQLFKDILLDLSNMFLPIASYSNYINSDMQIYMLQSVLGRIIKFHYRLLDKELFNGEYELLEKCSYLLKKNDIYYGRDIIKSYFQICRFNLERKKYNLHNKFSLSMF